MKGTRGNKLVANGQKAEKDYEKDNDEGPGKTTIFSRKEGNQSSSCQEFATVGIH